MSSLEKRQRILGIDYGSKHIGLALSDLLGITAQPIDALTSGERLAEEIQAVVERESVRQIVVGLPLNLKGEEAQAAQRVQEFVVQLRSVVTCDVVLLDERFTTTIAQKTMRMMGTTKKQRRQRDGRIDSMAAAVILQNYLDGHRNEGRERPSSD
jgi:putative Holliday junction resolvase